MPVPYQYQLRYPGPLVLQVLESEKKIQDLYNIQHKSIYVFYRTTNFISFLDMVSL